MESVAANQMLGGKEMKIQAKLHSFGEMELYVGKRNLGRGMVSSLVKEMSQDGLPMGRDKGERVGDDKNAFAFDGEIKKDKINII